MVGRRGSSVRLLAIAVVAVPAVAEGVHDARDRYYGIAETNFAAKPTLDEGYFGRGFYFSQFPRYSDHYIQSFHGRHHQSVLMSWALLGTPFPVTERIDQPNTLCVPPTMH